MNILCDQILDIDIHYIYYPFIIIIIIVIYMHRVTCIKDVCYNTVNMLIVSAKRIEEYVTKIMVKNYI